MPRRVDIMFAGYLLCEAGGENDSSTTCNRVRRTLHPEVRAQRVSSLQAEPGLRTSRVPEGESSVTIDEGCSLPRLPGRAPSPPHASHSVSSVVDRSSPDYLLCEADSKKGSRPENSDPCGLPCSADRLTPLSAVQPAPARAHTKTGMLRVRPGAPHNLVDRSSPHYLLCEAGISADWDGTAGDSSGALNTPALSGAAGGVQNFTPCKFPRRPRGSYLAWRRAHLPRHDAWMRRDMTMYQELTLRELARDEMLRERFVYCVFCRALMIYAAVGHYYCPYQWLGVHEHARRASS